MLSEERQKRIEDYLQQVEFASLEDLSEQVDASVSTVRRDVTALEVLGIIRRTHGGARIVSPRTDEFVFNARDTHQLSEKEAIGRVCADLINPHQSIIMEAGTTVFHVARHLVDKPIQIITNSLPVANLFTSSNRTEVVVSGGVIYPRLGVLVGPQAVETFSKIKADVAVMSAGGITLEGITNSHGLLIDIPRAIINAVQQVIFCLDHTKFNRQSILPLCGLEDIDVVVTDSQAPPETIAALRARGVEVILAPGNGSGGNAGPKLEDRSSQLDHEAVAHQLGQDLEPSGPPVILPP